VPGKNYLVLEVLARIDLIPGDLANLNVLLAGFETDEIKTGEDA
jgi:hypothetical protein